MTGDFYFSKPPLYNWILIFFFKVCGSYQEYVPRLATVLFSFIFTYLIYSFNKNRIKDQKYVILIAFMFLTCGRMIFYDSFLGLIDIFFSMVTYAMILLAYQYAEKDRYNTMYAIIYFLSLIGFMLKGLPTLHFLLFTILVIHYLFGQWRKLYSVAHLASLSAMIAIILLYFLVYDQYMDATKTIAPIVDQAARRTILKFGLKDMLHHIVSYPIENLYHFFPWSILGFLVFRKDIVSILRKDRYITYVTLCFLLNYIVYWVSPEVYPRYILMLIPLAFTVWIYLYQYEIGQNNLRMQVIAILFKIIAFVIPFIILYAIDNPGLKYTSHYQVKLAILVVALLATAFIYILDQANRPMLFVVYILLLRIGMNALIFPARAATGDDEVYKREAIRIAQSYGPLKLYGQTKLNQITAYYITSHTHQITNRTSDLSQAKYFIIDSTYRTDFIKIDSFPDASFCGTRWIIKGEK